MNIRTAKALGDIESSLFWSAENFGIPAAHRYRVLLDVALSANPTWMNHFGFFSGREVSNWIPALPQAAAEE